MTPGNRTAPRWPHLLARISTTSMAVLAVAQATFAGSFLGGQYDSLMLHSLVARAMTVLAAVQLIALVFVRRAGGPRSVIPVGTVLLLLLVTEFALGELRMPALHVPLGVLLVAGILQLAASIWRTPLPQPRMALS